jgi:hypothetical protein
MQIADLMLKEKDIESNERIADKQMQTKLREKQQNDDYIAAASQSLQ